MRHAFFIALLLALSTSSLYAQERNDRLLLDLKGKWLFRTGDQAEWMRPNLDEKDWQAVSVPSAWENQGSQGYDGYAWYRKHFKLSPGLQKQPLLLSLGRIDDVDQTFINGHFIGSTGRMGRDYSTAYQERRLYRIPREYLNPSGDNVISVRVFDERLEGGILEGQIGILEDTRHPALAVDLSGRWQFHAGDKPAWRERKIDQAGWTDVTVPGRWEAQGFPELDGFAWYRKAFLLPKSIDLSRDKIVLLLGKIDDLDEVYLNGELIGRTGRLDERDVRGSEWQHERIYDLPASLLRPGEYNLLAVRVYDGTLDGGIYEGPVGIATRAETEQHDSGLWNRWLEQIRELNH